MAVADLDGNGQGEAVIGFPGYGLWVWRNAASWSQLHPYDAQALTAADLDGNGRGDIVVDFGAAGLWALWNNTTWTQLHSSSPVSSVAAHFGQAPPPPTTPPPPSAPYRIGAVCNDGTLSNATGSGACSHHGGVRYWRYSDGSHTNP